MTTLLGGALCAWIVWGRGDALEALQQAGIVELLNAERAMVSKEWPELQVDVKRPRDMEDMVQRLEKTIAFLKGYETEKTSVFAPFKEIDKSKYSEVVDGKEALELLEKTETLQSDLDRLATERENTQGSLDLLKPWKDLETPVEEIRSLTTTTCMLGLIPHQHYDEIRTKLADMDAAIQLVGGTGNMHACIVGCLNEIAPDIQKILRSGDFEAISFEGMTGMVKELIGDCRSKLEKIHADQDDAKAKTLELAANSLTLKILYDHFTNLLTREKTQATSPATENVVFLEGWVRKNDFAKLEEIVAKFDASSVGEIDSSEDEEVPVEIDNPPSVRPFEVVTRLYGMPHATDVDPTVFFAPFFALFFGICLTDAAYGLIMIAFFAWLLRKIKGNAGFIWMMMFCSITTVIAGALTGGWCGDAIQQFIPALSGFRDTVMWFDPMEKPMHFFAISLALGYLQIVFGIAVAFVHKWRRKEYEAAIFDHLTWLIWINSLAILAAAKTGNIPAVFGTIFGVIAIVPGIGILLFSEREGGWGARVGMGFYNLFSTVFYVGDILSYIRLMALGMVTGGFGMAINQIAKQVMEIDVPVVGWLGGALIFVGGHLLNIANSGLGAFVHSMRLQFVEFFTKFLAGGGKQFEPLEKKYKHIQIDE